MSEKDRFEVLKPKEFREWIAESQGDQKFADAIDSLVLVDSDNYVYEADISILWLSMETEGVAKVIIDDTTPDFVGDFEVFEEDGIMQWVRASDAGNKLIYGSMYEYECTGCGELISMFVPNKSPYICPNEGCGRKNSFRRTYPPMLEEPLWLPSGKPVEANIETIYEEIREFAKAHLVLRSIEYDVFGLWILASYLVDDFTTCPYLAMTAPVSSGKTQVLEVIRQLAYRAYGVVDTTQSALFRAITTSRITLCIDEAQDSMKEKTEHGVAIRACMLAGYKRGIGALRNDDISGEWLPKNFELFGFKAFSGTSTLSPALASRSIEFKMRKAKPQNIRMDEEWSKKIRSLLYHWRFRTLGKLRIVDPPIDDGRLVELFSPLYTVGTGLDCNSLDQILEETQERNKNDERQSIESEIAMIVLELADETAGSDGFGERTSIAPSEIVERLGWDPKKGSTVSVGKYLKVLGIPTRHTRHGNMLDLGDPEIQTGIKYLRERYGF